MTCANMAYTRRSATSSLIRLRPRTFDAYHAERATQVADPPERRVLLGATLGATRMNNLAMLRTARTTGRDKPEVTD